MEETAERNSNGRRKNRQESKQRINDSQTFERANPPEKEQTYSREMIMRLVNSVSGKIVRIEYRFVFDEDFIFN